MGNRNPSASWNPESLRPRGPFNYVLFDTSGEGICYCQSFCLFRSIPISHCDAREEIKGKWNLWRYKTYWNTTDKSYKNKWNISIDQDLNRIRKEMIKADPNHSEYTDIKEEL